jgi:hypothetical protein
MPLSELRLFGSPPENSQQSVGMEGVENTAASIRRICCVANELVCALRHRCSAPGCVLACPKMLRGCGCVRLAGDAPMDLEPKMIAFIFQKEDGRFRHHSIVWVAMESEHA